MNIDTSILNSNNDLMNFSTSSHPQKSTGNFAFKSQFKDLQKSDDVKVEISKSPEKTETRSNAKKAEEVSKQEENKQVDVKSEDKTEKTEPKQEQNVENQDKGQNSQNNNQQGQYSQAEKLSEEILSMIEKNNKISDVNGVNNRKFVNGIHEDIYLFSPAIDYSAIEMSEDDAKFFAALVTKTDMSMQSIASEFQKSLDVNDIENVKKTAKVSAVLMEALSESMKTNKAFRIDFDKDISVIMRVDKNGNLNANFIPGDKAVEAYLRNNISYLKQRFDEQDLPYNDLTYSKHKDHSQNENGRNNKENKDE